MSVRERFPGVYTLDDGRLATANLTPGRRVYDEDLVRAGGTEYRTWNPTRSKLSAYVLKGAARFPIRPTSRVLYLGAANGTTVSHVSDIVTAGSVVALEFSPRTFTHLLDVAEARKNMVPVLGDAWRPDQYKRLAPGVDGVFQDISQREQAAIFLKNLEAFQPEWGIIAIKARSVDVAAEPREVYERVVQEVREAGWSLEEHVDLGPFEKDHAAALFHRRD